MSSRGSISLVATKYLPTYQIVKIDVIFFQVRFVNFNAKVADTMGLSIAMASRVPSAGQLAKVRTTYLSKIL